ncbi:MAG TPA: 2OG-Fe(II) oxygenase [Candidatus Acidoferrum sp.]|nr:2OG-Fe(II) oxygenase [Candidatus Acidoferrum sp.]
MARAVEKIEENFSIPERVNDLDWKTAAESLSKCGYAITAPILSPAECALLVGLYGDSSRFRSHIIMEKFRFGLGDYKYFAHPLPEIVTALRTHTYPFLAEIANDWAAALAETNPIFPREHAAFLKICHKAGQSKPTPLMLHYEAGGYNCLHQDLYGEVRFPLQMVLLLGQYGRDWEGGEFILVEQQPRAQSKAEVVVADQGQAIIFTTRYRPAKGSRGHYRVNLRHGVSRVHRGTRYTLGIIFHDAK